MRPSTYAIIEPEEASRLIYENVAQIGLEEISLLDGNGRILAEDIYAVGEMPPFDATAVDGYALRWEDGTETREIIGERTAGKVSDISVVAGTAVRIMTGAAMPPGANSVIMVEDTGEDNQKLIVRKLPQVGDNIRPTGQDLQAGQLALKAGTKLSAAELGLIATVNRPRFQAIRRPRIAIISTGDEIVEPGEIAAYGQIYDSNRFSLVAAVRNAGAEAVSLGIAPDTREGLKNLIEQALAEYDGVVTSGGVSVGKLDLVKDLLEEMGTIHFGRVNLKPGKPLTFVTVEVDGTRKPVFGLPGFPVSSLVSFELFVRPALLKMGGFAELSRPVLQVRTEHFIKHSPERNEFVRAIVTSHYDPETSHYWYSARTTGAQNSSRLLSMLGANALLKLVPGSSEIAEGSIVPAILLEQI
ncbi:gephyrin-like molybdotransferase Glp [Candidatus Chlorohelix sp.]|uniref:molybdopterin molybdotransferase MoeA n=1 Tax=Candidatus Chlorohelix sp. TaxID=3139201 RepID=UPI00304DB06B